MEDHAHDECQTRQLVAFEASGRRYGLPVEALVAIVPLESVDLVTTTGSSEATVRWRGRRLAVLDARADSESRSEVRGRVLIALRGDRGDAGIAADRLDSVVTYELEQVLPLPLPGRDALDEFVVQIVDPGPGKPRIRLLDPDPMAASASGASPDLSPTPCASRSDRSSSGEDTRGPACTRPTGVTSG